MDKDQIAQISSCYEAYRKTIKPLIIDLKSKKQLQRNLMNEIRDFNDHIARCYYFNSSLESDKKEEIGKKIDKEISKAEGHLDRLMLDCFKLSNLIFFKKIESAERMFTELLHKNNRGEFISEHYRLKNEARNHVINAKEKESLDFESSIASYQSANTTYAHLCLHIKKNYRNILKWFIIRVLFMILTIVVYLSASLFEHSIPPIIKKQIQPKDLSDSSKTVTNLKINSVLIFPLD